jgi:choline dehydrogenase-like flavoprotein
MLNRLVDSGVPLPPPGIQNTTLSVDGVARYTCNTWDEVLAAQSDRPFDVVIVGSGMYGGYTAAKLFELGQRMAAPQDAPRVLVLESGPFLITEHIQNLTRRSSGLSATVAEDLVEPGQTNEHSLVKHYRCVGGKSLFWGGWAPRLLPADLQRVDATGERLWPQEIEAYLFQTGFRGGYEYCERELGIFPVQGFMQGALYDALKQLVDSIVAAQTVPMLTRVLPPPIAVQGDSPGSGLFSFDKFSSIALLHDCLREDAEVSGGNDALRRLFLVPNAEVIRLETTDARVREVVVALADPQAPHEKSKARVVRLGLASSAVVVLAGNTINSTRLALNSFPRPSPLNTNGELMGRNLMFHSRSNFVWRVRRSAMGVPGPDPARVTTAALHITGAAPLAGGGAGQFHFQFYAAPNMDTPMFPGASKDPERFLYQMAPNLEDIESMLEAQNGLGNDRVAIGIRTVGETFGDRASPIASDLGVSWMNVNPFGGIGDDVYTENGQPVRIPKAYVHLAKTGADEQVWAAQDDAAAALITAMTNAPPIGDDPPPAPVIEVIAQVPEAAVPNDSYRTENTTAGRMFVGRFGGQLRVLDGTCTHEGCFVNWIGTEGRFGCDCHTARFAADGTNISGPPPRPLDKPQFRVQGGNVEILRATSAADVEIVAGVSDGIGTTYHEAGTLWLGTDFRKSVTDINARFHHVANAYCVDQSIFPTVGSANPVLTGIALSRRTAQSIIERHVSADLAALEPGFSRLYVGDFVADGWQIAPGGSANFFDVSDNGVPVLGAGIDNRSPALGVLWYTLKRYRDFVLRLDFKAWDSAANSGIFLRMPAPAPLDDAFYDSTVEVQIDESGHDSAQQIFGSPLHRTGAVYGVFPARQWAAKVVPPRQSGRSTFWNSAQITLQGAAVEVRINDMLVAQGQFPNLIAWNAPSAGTAKRDEGFIGLQCHTEVVQFRNIRIQEL